MNHVLKQLSMLAFALVFMTGVAFAQEEVKIEQINGNDNFAKVEHTSYADDAKSIVKQDGSANSATAKITSSNSGDKRGLTDQTQIGNNNVASINEVKAGQDNPVNDEFVVDVKQFQEGNKNVARAGFGFQTGANNGELNIRSDITQIQKGHRNSTRVQADGIGSIILQKQDGNDNVIRFDLPQIDNAGLSNSSVKQQQLFGNNNTMTVESEASGISGSADEFGQVNNTTVDMMQREGNFNVARITGLGSDSMLMTFQKGNNNSITGDLRSNAVDYDVRQVGNGNTAVYDGQ
jgi:hypothetical protein